ncbi:hypothetical protein [Streptomyces sp. 6N223]|uniref:hypothetical protein n=1 Tax=Streptomyces sp. 6N223 TaxID=3457412 RepID=UPI003FD67371
MSVQTSAPVTPVFAGSAEHAAMTSLMSEPEAPVSGAPVYSPQAGALLLALTFISPKPPKEPRKK